jgi:cell wall-associated NlpC family hydrolase
MLVGQLLETSGEELLQVIAGFVGLVALVVVMAALIPVAVVVDRLGRAGDLARTNTQLAAAATNGDANPPRADPMVASPSVQLDLGSAAVQAARHYLGVSYVFGGTDPSIGLDCSGLVQLVFRQLGVKLPRTAQLQFDVTARVPREQLRPGDLVFFARTYADPNDWITHVGIYVGNGMQINAPMEGQVVSIQPVFTGFWGSHFVAGGRTGSV